MILTQKEIVFMKFTIVIMIQVYKEAFKARATNLKARILVSKTGIMIQVE
jgi:hypothetical protein